MANMWISGALITLCCARLSAADLVLVAKGKPNAVIIAAVEPQATRAAAEIQKYIEKMSGAKLPIVTEGRPTPAGCRSRSRSATPARREELGSRSPPASRKSWATRRCSKRKASSSRPRARRSSSAGTPTAPTRGRSTRPMSSWSGSGAGGISPASGARWCRRRRRSRSRRPTWCRSPTSPLRDVSLGGWIPVHRGGRKQPTRTGGGRSSIRPDGISSIPPVGDGFLAYLLPPKEIPGRRSRRSTR